MTGTSEDPGIIPLTAEYIFNAISNIIQCEFLLRFALKIIFRLYIFIYFYYYLFYLFFSRVSYLEIYDERINDLLDKNQIDLELYKDNNEQIIVKCTEKITNSSDDMLSIMKEGIKNKHINSHSIFQIVRLHRIFYIICIYI